MFDLLFRVSCGGCAVKVLVVTLLEILSLPWVLRGLGVTFDARGQVDTRESSYVLIFLIFSLEVVC